MEDNELIRQYLAGDEASFDLLVQNNLRSVFNFVYRYLGNRLDAEDVTQEVFLRVWRNLKRFSLDKKFKTWVLTIAKNAALDFLKKKKLPLATFLDDTGQEISAAELLVDPKPLPDQIMDQAERQQQLEALMKFLKPIQRAVLVLHYQEGLTFQEIAELYAQPLNTVKSYHYRALVVIREKLASECTKIN
ncbi:MAG: RNA polymerase sigma factor [Candidatus Buchananbacteria bacterium]